MTEEKLPAFNMDEYLLTDPNSDMGGDLVREEDTVQARQDSSFFIGAGLVAAAGGTWYVLSEAVTSISGLHFEWANKLALGAGVVALLVGGAKAVKKIFMKSNLNLPSLTVKKKVVQHAPPAARPEAFKVKGGLFKSRTDKVFSGVAAGLAAKAGIQSGLMRLLLIIAFMMSGGMIAFAYLVLSAILPEEPAQQESKPRTEVRNIQIH